MSKKKIIWISIAAVLSIAAIADAIRYLKAGAEVKQIVHPEGRFPVTSAKEIILVYNAWGGLYPGLADFVHKEFFPASYPCNLCYQTFGTFSMKDEWKQFLDSLRLKKTELHKDNFKRLYQPEDLPLPVIIISDGTNVQLLLTAAEINQLKSLAQLMERVKVKLHLKEDD